MSEDEKEYSSELYDAATNALAAEASDINTFEKMVTYAAKHLDSAKFKAEVVLIEKLIKTEFSLTSMPSPWRSAKSVCYGALALGVNLYDENLQIKGKTRLQNDIKLAKIVGTEEKDPLQVVLDKLQSAFKLYGSLENEDQIEVLRAIKASWGVWG